MKSRLLSTAAFIASLAAAPVLAQPDQQRDHNGGAPSSEAPHNGPQGGAGPRGGAGPHGGGGAPHEMGGPQHGGAPGGPHGPGGMGGGAPQVHTESRPAMAAPGGREEHQRGERDQHGDRGQPGWNGGNANTSRDVHPDRNGSNRGGQPGWNGHGPGHGGPAIPRGSVSARGGHFTFQGRSFSRARAPAFRYPRGYGYRRWGVGVRLPRLFLSPTYYFTDYAMFGFGPPPWGDQWVRYGPDLLLVDIDTGEVVYVIYGAFY